MNEVLRHLSSILSVLVGNDHVTVVCTFVQNGRELESFFGDRVFADAWCSCPEKKHDLPLITICLTWPLHKCADVFYRFLSD